MRAVNVGYNQRARRHPDSTDLVILQCDPINHPERRVEPQSFVNNPECQMEFMQVPKTNGIIADHAGNFFPDQGDVPRVSAKQVEGPKNISLVGSAHSGYNL